MKKYLLAALLFIVAIVAFVAVCCEDTPDMTMPFAHFVLIKLAGLAILLADILAGKYFAKKGWLPELPEVK